MTLTQEAIARIQNSAPSDQQITDVINQLDANYMGVRLAVALIGGEEAVREALEARINLPPGQRAIGMSAEHNERRLHVGVVSCGLGDTSFHEIFIDDGYRRFPESVISLAGKLASSEGGPSSIWLGPVYDGRTAKLKSSQLAN